MENDNPRMAHEKYFMGIALAVRQRADCIGQKVGAALVGTFLGILLCYGLVGPLAANMTKAADEEHAFLYVMRVLMVSFLKGTAPIMAVEVARRAVPGHVRPSFTELERACRGGGAPAAAAAAS